MGEATTVTARLSVLAALGIKPMATPRLLPVVTWGQLGVMVTVIGATATALWVAFSLIGDIKAQLATTRIESTQRIAEITQQYNNQLAAIKQDMATQVYTLEAKVALLQQREENEITANAAWRADIKDQLKSIFKAQQDTVEALARIQLGMANKVDRKP